MLFLSLADVLLVFFLALAGFGKILQPRRLSEVSFVKPSKKRPVLFFVKGDRRIWGGGGVHIVFSGNRVGGGQSSLTEDKGRTIEKLRVFFLIPFTPSPLISSNLFHPCIFFNICIST